MKASELRIGNWVSREDLFDRSPRDTQIIFLGEKATVTGPIKVICEYEDLSGIPLTDERLENFGFTNIHKVWMLGDFTIYVARNGFCVVINGKRIEVKYVHTLQNLFSVLTDQELTTQNATDSGPQQQNQ